MGRPRMYRSISALASKGVHLVYLPPETSLADGRVLKMMYSAPFSIATSAIVLPLLYSISKLSGLMGGVVMAKTVCAPVKAVSRVARLSTSPWTTSTFSLSYLAFSELTSRVTARILYFWESSGSFSTYLMTELPCWPIAPKTARMLDMF